MKKNLLILLGLLIALPSFARDFEYTYEGQTLTYTVLDEAAKTCQTKSGSASNSTAGNSVSGDLIIPEKASDGSTEYSVTTIGDYAFFNCDGLTSVTIPNSVTTIDYGAFWGCSGLTSVTIGESVTTIGIQAFYGCSGLTKAEFASIESLCNINFVMYSANPLANAHHLYINGEEITDVVIPETVTTIGYGAFYGCSGLTSVTIPNSVTTIGEYAFGQCSGLTSVTIPNSVTSIGMSAFSDCDGLTSVTIPNSVTSIGSGAFSSCI